MNKDFETILKRYAMPQGINWESVRRKIEVELSLIQKPSDEGTAADEGREYDATEIDSEALIRTIKLLEAGGAIEIKGARGSVQIEDAALKHFVLLSLHKLLQMKWGLDKPTEEELQEGALSLFALGQDCADEVQVGIKEDLGNGFIQPYNSEELEALLKLSLGIKNYKKIRQGRGKNVAYYGDCVAAVLGAIPEEVKAAKGKTDLLNFVGEVMELEGILDNSVYNWELGELERAEASPICVTGGIRKKRQKMLAHWLEGARRIYCQSELPACKDCKNYGKCFISERLKNYTL